MKKKIFYILSTFSMLALSSSLVILFWVLNDFTFSDIFEKPSYEDMSEIKLEELNEFTFTPEEVITDLGESNYIQANLIFVVSDKDMMTDMELYSSFIQSQLIKIFNNLNEENFNTSSKVSSVEDLIKETINNGIEKGEILNAYFTKLLIH